MKHIVSVSLGDTHHNFDLQTEFMGLPMRVCRVGTNGSTSKAVALLRHWETRADVLGLGVARDNYSVAGKRYVEPDSTALKTAVTRVPITTGARLQDILQEWAVRHVQTTLPHFFNNARVLFLSGKEQYRLALCLAEYTQNLQFADAVMQHGLPRMLHGVHALELFTKGVDWVPDWVPGLAADTKPVKQWANAVLLSALKESTVLVAMPHEVDALMAHDLAGKVVVSCGVNDARAQ
ncbi:MAG: dehydrogenase, partial [Rhodoferax sp.]